LDAGVLPDGRPYLVSEYCPGGTLADLVRPAVAVVVELGATLAGTLARAHAEGVVHRDLKPANVLLRADGEPALADFGLSVRPAGGASRGADALSVEWAAPETLERGEYGPASDVYGLGATLYAVLAGRPPFAYRSGEGELPFMRRVVADPVPPPGRDDVPDALWAL